MAKKEAKKEELETVNGGTSLYRRCPNCGFAQQEDLYEKKYVEATCGTTGGTYCKCPNCGEWFTEMTCR